MTLAFYLLLNFSLLLSIYLDGAHTAESIKVCSKWFRDATKENHKISKILVFNVTGNRNTVPMMRELQKSSFFDQVFFVPNIAAAFSKLEDNDADPEQLEMCRNNQKIWQDLEEEVISDRKSQTKIFENVLELLQSQDRHQEHDVLVTGSLHLIGAFLQALEEFDREIV